MQKLPGQWLSCICPAMLPEPCMIIPENRIRHTGADKPPTTSDRALKRTFNRIFNRAFTAIHTMGNRLSKIATRTGDDGTTGLGDNTRVSKASLRIASVGDVDELNSHLGLLLCEELPENARELLVDIQHQLFNLGGELSMPGYELLKDSALLQIDQAIADYTEQLPPLKEFILPAGSRAAAQAHVCRTVARRAERTVVALAEEETAETLRPALKHYLNRLSDWLFMLARTLNHTDGGDDVYWKSERLQRLEEADN